MRIRDEAVGKAAVQTENFQSCLSTGETIDQQLVRLVACQSGGGNVLIPGGQTQPFYELPTGSPVNAPVDTMEKADQPPLPDPAPAPPPGTDPLQPKPKTDVLQWVKENPLLTAGGLVALLLLVRKKR